MQPVPDGATRTPAALQAYKDKFFNRVKDLVDSYRPDLLYFDDTVPPLGAAGMNVVVHFLNANREWHHGKMEAVFNTKIYDFEPPQDVYKCLVDDFEGGRANTIQPYPWQTYTCIGNWHYYGGIKYRTAENVIQELVDIVSKNGNLLLNIPVRGDGSIDEDELKFLAGLTKWMDVNSEGSRTKIAWRWLPRSVTWYRPPGTCSLGLRAILDSGDCSDTGARQISPAGAEALAAKLSGSSGNAPVCAPISA